MALLGTGQRLCVDLGRWLRNTEQKNASQCICQREVGLLCGAEPPEFFTESIQRCREPLLDAMRRIGVFPSLKLILNGRANECRR